jgi:adenylate cyclase
MPIARALALREGRPEMAKMDCQTHGHRHLLWPVISGLVASCKNLTMGKKRRHKGGEVGLRGNPVRLSLINKNISSERIMNLKLNQRGSFKEEEDKLTDLESFVSSNPIDKN